MITFGIDLAAQPKGTAVCRIIWEDNKAKVEKPNVNLDNGTVVALCQGADKIGMDVPLGWPKDFVEFVSGHHKQEFNGQPSSQKFRLRATDRYVYEQTKKCPLSVSTGFLGIVSFRAATGITPALTSPVLPDRTGKGKITEVYPAAALVRWGFRPRPKEETALLFDQFTYSCQQWMQIAPEAMNICRTNRDAFDALICALVARASALGLCDAIPGHIFQDACAEGWIALPVGGSLSLLKNS